MTDEEIAAQDALNLEKENAAKAEEERLAAEAKSKEDGEPTFTDAERKAFARAKVAEAKVKELKAQLDKGTSKSSGDSEFGQKAYLIANGIKGAKEFDFVKAELKASGQDLDTLLENDYFKSKLEKFRGLQQTADATPTGKRSSGVATESVEYWMTQDFEKVPHDMRAKVVQALRDKEGNKGHFYNSPK